jgi:hypothetical protein
VTPAVTEGTLAPSFVFNTDGAITDLENASAAVAAALCKLGPGLFHTLVAAVGATMAIASDPVFKLTTADKMGVQEDEADREYDKVNGAFHESLAALSTSLNPHLTGTSTADLLEECELKVAAEWPAGFCDDALATLVKAIADAKEECKGEITYAATKEHLVTSLTGVLASVIAVFKAEPTGPDNPAPEHLREAEQQLSAARRHEEQERDGEMSDCRKNHRQTLHDGLTDSYRALELVRAMITQVGEVKVAVAATLNGGATAEDPQAKDPQAEDPQAEDPQAAALEQLSKSLREGATIPSLGSAAELKPGQTIALWSRKLSASDKGHFVMMDQHGNVRVNKDVVKAEDAASWIAPTGRTCERFTVVNAGDGKIALHSTRNNRFVRITHDHKVDGLGGERDADKLPPAEQWGSERFTAVDAGDGTIALHGTCTNLFMRRRGGGSGVLDTATYQRDADKLPAGWPSERFRAYLVASESSSWLAGINPPQSVALEQLAKSLREGALKLQRQQKRAQRRCNVAAERHTQLAKMAAAAAVTAMGRARRHQSGYHGKVGLSYSDLSLIISTELKSAAKQQKIAVFETAQCNQLWSRLQATDDEVDAILAKYAHAETHVVLQMRLLQSSQAMLESTRQTLMDVCTGWMGKCQSFKTTLLVGVAELTSTLIAYYSEFEALPAMNKVKYCEAAVSKAKAKLQLERDIASTDVSSISAARTALKAAQAASTAAIEAKDAVSTTVADLKRDHMYEAVLAEIEATATGDEKAAVQTFTKVQKKREAEIQTKGASFDAWMRAMMNPSQGLHELESGSPVV